MDVRPPDKVMAWIGPLAITGFFLWFLLGQPSVSLCDKTQNCLATWTSALSGWVAVLAAFLTIRSIRRQIDETNRHHAENVEISMMPKFALARRVRELVKGQLPVFFVLAPYDRPGNPMEITADSFDEISDAVLKVQDYLSDPDLVEFSRTIADDVYAYRSWIDHAMRCIAPPLNRIRTNSEQEGDFAEVRTNLKTLASLFVRHVHDRENEAHAFLVKWRQKVDPPFSFGYGRHA